jgi:CysZ protein
MSAWSQIGLGIRSYVRALNIIFSKGILKFFIFPLLLTIILFIIGQHFFNGLQTSVKTFVLQHISFKNYDFFLAKYLDTILSGVLWIMLEFLFFLAFAYIGANIINMILSPVFARVSEKIEKITNGIEYPSDFKQNMKDVLRGIILAMRTLLLQVGILILVLIISFIPVIGWFSTIVMFFVNSYFFGFSFMDYTCERHRLSVRESMKLTWANRWIAITIGGIFSLILFIPFCGIALSAFMTIFSVTAATLAMIDPEFVWKKD